MNCALPPAINAAAEALADFDEPTTNLPATSDGRHFAPYLLDGGQVGAVKHLLWKAKKLAEENYELRQMLSKDQGFIDRSIAYLDSDRN